MNEQERRIQDSLDERVHTIVCTCEQKYECKEYSTLVEGVPPGATL